MKLENGTWVAVCDGGKFLLLQNKGDADLIDLRVIAHEERSLETLAQLRDRGPSPDGHAALVGRADSTSVEDLAEHRFVQSIASELTERIVDGSMASLVLIADPKTLGLLRSQLPEVAHAAIRKEIAGDHAHQTVAQVENLLTHLR
ncbi:MAG: host attachment protein [Henriciella sp.]|nr:host attachment protein [Henriciella sp.]